MNAHRFGLMCIYIPFYSIMEEQISTEQPVSSWLQAMTTTLLSMNTVLTKLKNTSILSEWLTNRI